MKILVVAHPDDEVLFFNPEEYDKIVIVFTDRRDVADFGNRRLKALEEHPLRDKIEIVGITESGYNTRKDRYEDFVESYHELCDYLDEMDIKDDDEITTHNAYGEYGHTDHKLVFNALMDTVDCKVNNQDPKLYREIKRVYEKHGVWTWYIGGYQL